MKNIILLLFTCTLALNLSAQNVPNFAWAQSIASNVNDNTIIQNITVDDEGNYYRQFKYVSQSYNLDGIQVTSTYNPNNGYDNIYGYLAKYDKNNNVVWAISLTNIIFDNNSNKILIDDHGDIYLYGNYTTNSNHLAYLGDSLLTNDLIPSQNNSPASNGIFLSKLKSTGEILWIKKNELSTSSGTNLGSDFTSLSFDSNGHIQLLGIYKGNVSFVAEDTLLASNQDELNAFYAIYSPSGTVLESRKLTGGSYNQGGYSPKIEAFDIDAVGNIYRLQDQNTYKKLFRYDSYGNFIDSLMIDVSSTSPGLRLLGFTVSPSGDVYIGGYSMGNLTVGNFSFPHYGSQNNAQGFLFKLATPDYQIAWADTIQANRSTSIKKLKTDELGNIYAIGEYSNAQEAACSFRKYTASGELLWYQTVAGLTTPQVPYTGIIVTEGLVLTQNGGNVWISGKFSRNIYFSPTDHFTTPATNSYKGFLAQYGVCNTPNPTIDIPFSTQLCGSDSITLSATLDNPNTTYFWSTPYGKVEIDNSTTNATLTVGQVGKYALISQEDAECYGKSQEIWITNAPLPDTSVTVQNNILTATENSQGTTYQWVDCQNNNMSISGATAQTFEPTANGAYAVIITSENGCSDTSSCHIISTLSIQNNPMLDKQITLYPNPTSNEVNIQTDLDVSEVYILDLQGKELQKTSSKNVNLSKLSSGIYLIKVKLKNNEVWTSKVIKN